PVPEAGTGWGIGVKNRDGVGFGALWCTGPGQVRGNVLASGNPHQPRVLGGGPLLAMVYGVGGDSKIGNFFKAGELVVPDAGEFFDINHGAPVRFTNR